MLVTSKVQQALDAKKEDFRKAAREASELRSRYIEAWRQLGALSTAELTERLAGNSWPGARLAETSSPERLVVRFAERWDTAQDARAWAIEKLRAIPTVAVDGSQIAASKEFGVPVSLVQVSYFENYHDPARPYIKDVRNEVVTVDDGAGEIDEYVFAESTLNRSRFALEMQTAVDRIRALSHDPPPVVFVDGSFVLSFAGRMPPRTREAYLDALFGLLDASEECRVPVIGYVDRSFASDLVTLLRTVFDLPDGGVFDAQILAELLGPFDRTVAFECARGDVLPLYEAARTGYVHDLLFVYLQSGHDRLPVRVDVPRWVVEARLLDHVLDVVRAETVVGSGYPYALETADAATVLTTEDRLAFYQIFHEFARQSGLVASLPAKSMSKARRR
ncbi:MAG TPA: DNA double-strand break repair nuclease NurA [Chloroflexota bacterium]